MDHDDDGNLAADGRYVYVWDAENRLVAVEEQVCPTNRALHRVEYDYDHRGRMVWKTASSFNSLRTPRSLAPAVKGAMTARYASGCGLFFTLPWSRVGL